DAAPVLAAALEVALAAAARVDLRLEHDRGAQLVEGPRRLVRVRRHHAARHGGAGGREQLFRLIFVDLHRLPSGRNTTLSLYATRSEMTQARSVSEGSGRPLADASGLWRVSPLAVRTPGGSPARG